MRVVRWRNASTGVESFTITATGIYFPVGKVDSAFVARYAMASAGQTAAIERVVSADGTRVGTPGISVSGTTEVVSNDRRGLSTGIIITSISGTLIPVLDNLSPITNWPDNLGRFTAMEDLVAYCYGSTVPVGTRAIVGTTEYSWNGSAWAAAGNIAPTYGTWDLAVAAAGSTLGWTGYVKRLCGNGYFRAMHNGVRLGVECGESIIRDAGVNSAGYDLTATGTVYVPLASYMIPAGMVGDGEEWEFDIHAMSLEIHASGSDYVDTYIGGTKLLGTAPLLSLVNQVVRKRGALVRLNNTLVMRAGTVTADLYSAVSSNDAVVDMSIQQEMTAGFSPGAVTNKMRLRHFCFRRIG